MPKTEILERPKFRVGAVAHRGAFSGIQPAFQRLFQVIRAHDALTRIGGHVAIYYSTAEAVPVDDLRSHAGAIFTDDLPLPPGLEEVTLPEGRYAVHHHKGGYEGLGAAWQDLFEHGIPGLGATGGGNLCYEHYVKNPMNASPHEYLTDLCQPLA